MAAAVGQIQKSEINKMLLLYHYQVIIKLIELKTKLLLKILIKCKPIKTFKGFSGFS